MKNPFRNILFMFAVFFVLLFNFTRVLKCGVLDSVSDSTKSLEKVLAPILSQAFNELLIPGAIVGVWMQGYEPYIAAFGVSDLSSKIPIKTDDKMRVGSITKTMTATVLLQLVDEGRISLSDKLSKYFPGYPDGDNITIEEVGNMTSGLFNYTEDKTFARNMIEDPLMPYTPVQLIDISRKHPSDFPPGTSLHYSNTNYVLLGMIIEQITGNTLQSEIQKRILDRLGMTNSKLAVDADFPNPHAHGYDYVDSSSLEPTDITDMNPSWAWAAGSMISTLEDLKKYAEPLATGELLSSETHAMRLKLVDFPPSDLGPWTGMKRYGFGITDFGGALGHYGGVLGFSSFMGYIPEKDATVIVLVNMQANKDGIVPADYLEIKIIEKLKGM